MLSYFLPPIVDQGQTPLRFDAVEHGSESSDCRSGEKNVGGAVTATHQPQSESR